MQPKMNSTRNPNKVELPQAIDALDRMKYEVAKELGIEVPMIGKSYDWRMVPSYYCGIIGGEVVKRSMQYVEKLVSDNPEMIEKILSAVEDGETVIPSHVPEPAPFKGLTKPISPNAMMDLANAPSSNLKH